MNHSIRTLVVVLLALAAAWALFTGALSLTQLAGVALLIAIIVVVVLLLMRLLQGVWNKPA